jgi:hypothetical protein
MRRLGLLLLALAIEPHAPQRLTLEIRIFLGPEDVTREARVTLHRAGERGQPVSQIGPGRHSLDIQVPPGTYDAQAVQERDGRVINIRWALRLVVMPYPDEGGRHLEVINFTAGYGALQVRAAEGAALDLALFGAGERRQPTRVATAPGYTLFVVPAGQYDVQVRRGSHTIWHNGIEVPLDRTRLWVVP